MKNIIKKLPDWYFTFMVYCLIGWLYEVLWLMFVVPPYKFVNRGVLFGPFLPIYGFGMLILLVLLHKTLNKKHVISNKIYLLTSVSTITTFIYTTIIEYTTPKIYRVDYFLQHYGIGLLLVNVLALIVVYLIVDKTKNKNIKNIDTTIVLVFLLIWIITTIIEYVSHYAIDKLSHKLLWDYTHDFLNINKRVNWDASRNFAIGGTFLLYTVQPLLDKVLKKINIKPKTIIAIIMGSIMLIDFIINVVIK
ncbi:MAG: hypothetical protein E7160_02625 [Firmicutes bacterium]|nr:hypothetical protein [Bacillota bacterium]